MHSRAVAQTSHHAFSVNGSESGRFRTTKARGTGTSTRAGAKGEATLDRPPRVGVDVRAYNPRARASASASVLRVRVRKQAPGSEIGESKHVQWKIWPLRLVPQRGEHDLYMKIVGYKACVRTKVPYANVTASSASPRSSRRRIDRWRCFGEQSPIQTGSIEVV